MVKVSVVVAVYNTQAYLAKCLDSILNQSLKDIEIIVVDDGSKDGSGQICDDYGAKFDNVKVYHQENGGVSLARNLGVSKASGKYIGFVDSDDYIEQDMYEKMYLKAESEDLDVVSCDSINVYPDGTKRYIKTVNVDSDDEIARYIISMPMVAVRLFKREVFDKIKFASGLVYEDFQLLGPTVSVCHKFGYVNEGLYYYIQRDGSITHQLSDRFKDIFKVLQSNYDYLYQDYPVETEYLYISHLLRTATLKLLEYDNSRELLDLVNQTMKEKFPNWSKNKYYLNSSKKLQLVCTLAYHKCYRLLKIIKKVTKR